MTRILLADHSPHAQRMGERILRDEGYEVATVTDGETALLRLKDLAPDLVLADISLPSRNGYEVCEYVKTSGKYPQTKVILTAGPVTAFDEGRAQSAGSDGFVRKPFEASVLLGALQPLVEKPEVSGGPKRESRGETGAKTALPKPLPVVAAPPPPKPIDREQVRAAVILALEASMITIIENITDKVVVAIEAETAPAPPAQPKAVAPEPKPAIPEPKRAETASTGAIREVKPAEVKPAEVTTAAFEPKVVSATAPKPAPPVAAAVKPPDVKPPEPKSELKSEPAPTQPPEEPVVRIRTPLFRSLS